MYAYTDPTVFVYIFETFSKKDQKRQEKCVP